MPDGAGYADSTLGAIPADGRQAWRLRRAHQSALATLDAFDRFLLLDSPALSFGEIIVMAAQNGLNVFLEVFTKLAYLFLYTFLRFRLHAQ